MLKKFMVILVVALSGCASMELPIAHDLSKDTLTDESSMIIVSTWANDKSISFASMLTIYKADGDEALLSFNIDSYVLKPHFQEGWGFLNVSFLEPGEYRYELYNLNPYYTYYRFEKPITFRVQGNEVIYLGEAYLDGEYLRIRDKRVRDIPMFLERNTEFTEQDITIALPLIRYSKS